MKERSNKMGKIEEMITNTVKEAFKEELDEKMDEVFELVEDFTDEDTAKDLREEMMDSDEIVDFIEIELIEKAVNDFVDSVEKNKNEDSKMPLYDLLESIIEDVIDKKKGDYTLPPWKPYEPWVDDIIEDIQVTWTTGTDPDDESYGDLFFIS